MSRALIARSFAAALVAAALCRGAAAEEPELIAEEAVAVVPVDTESRLTLRGFSGDLNLRAGRESEIRFMSTLLGQPSKKIPVAVLSAGTVLTLQPASGTEEQPRTLEVVADPRLFARIIESRGAVTVSGLQAGVEVVGQVLDVDVRGVSGPVQVTTTGGRSRIESINGDVNLHSRSSAVTIARIQGPLTVSVEDSTFDAASLAGGIEGEFRGTQWSLTDIQKPAMLRSAGGTATVRGLVMGGEIRLTGTPMTLTESKGDIDIETDNDFRFQKTEASLHVNSYGGSVTGAGNQGLVEVRTDGSHVTLSEIMGPLRVQGDNLTLRVKGVSGELFVDAKSSDLDIDGTGGEVSVISANSSVVIRNASESVEVESEGGQVEILELRGTVTVKADSERVVVAWAGQPLSKACSVRNTGGGVEMRFPANFQAQLDVESRFGTVQSDLEEFESDESSSQVKGALGKGINAPVIKIVADRDVVLTHRAADE